MRVRPIYSKESNVYHNNDECLLQNNIQKQDFETGTGKLPLCTQCMRLGPLGDYFKTKVRNVSEINY